MRMVDTCPASGRPSRRGLSIAAAIAAAFVPALGLAAISETPAFAQEKKPNILVIWGDDIGASTSPPTIWG